MLRRFALATTLTCGAGAALAGTDFNALLPDDIREAGVLRVAATNDGVPPMLYLGDDLETLAGVEADLVQAMADLFGVGVEYTLGTFDMLIPAIAADRADFALGTIGDLKARQEVVDFVDYMKAGVGLAVRAPNAEGITDDPASLCGHSVAVQRGAFQEQELLALQPFCAERDAPLDIQIFGEMGAAIMALRTGRVDVWSGDSAPLGLAIAQSEGELEQAGDLRPLALIGFAVNKADTRLRDALKAAMEALVADGTYAAILAKWGQTAAGVAAITINDAWL